MGMKKKTWRRGKMEDDKKEEMEMREKRKSRFCGTTQPLESGGEVII